MNKTPRLFPVLVAVSLFLGSTPLPAAAQVMHGALGASAGLMHGPVRIAAASPSGAMSMPLMPGASLNTMQLAPAAPAPILNSVLSAQSGVSISARPDDLNAIAVEAAAYATPAPAAKSAKTVTPAATEKGFVGRLLDAARGRAAPSISFDGAREKSAAVAGRMGLREQKPLKLPNGTRTDEQATIPSPDREAITLVESYGLPGGRDIGGIFETSRKVLSADPANVDSVVSAVKAMIDADRARYGVTSADLRLLGATPFKGRGTQADSIFIVFRQIKNGLEINGSSLSFTIKVIGDKPTVVAQTGQVFPQIDVNTETVFTDDQIRDRIAARTGLSTHDVAEKFKFYQEKIIYGRGAWHHVKLYVADGLPFMVAVDVLNGDVFAWDNRAGLVSDEIGTAEKNSAAIKNPSKSQLQKFLDTRNDSFLTNKDLLILRNHLKDVLIAETSDGRVVLKVQYILGTGQTPETFEPQLKANMLKTVPAIKRYADSILFEALSELAAKKQATVSGTIKGKTVDKGPIMSKAELAEIPLAFLEIQIGNKTYVTDKDGRFSSDADFDAAAGTVLTATLSGPYIRVQDDTGKTLSINVTIKPGDNQIVFNPDANLDNENALAQVNAFRTVNRALNYLRERKLTTAQMDSTQMPIHTNISQECNAYYTPGSPSENFFRSSVNCVNSAYDSVSQHETGHYWDDFTPGGIVNGGLSEGWGDILSMFDLNNPIIGEHFMKKARNGVDYIRHGDNTYQYNEYDEVHAQGQAWGGFAWKLRKALIEKLGKAEGASVAESLILPTMFAKATTIPDAIKQVLVSATDRSGNILHEDEIRAAAKAHGIELPQSASFADTMRAHAGPLSKMSLNGVRFKNQATPAIESLLTGAAASPTIKARMTFTVGMLYRTKAISELRRYLDAEGVKYDLREYSGWFSSDYLLTIEGSESEVRPLVETIQRWFDGHSS